MNFLQKIRKNFYIITHKIPSSQLKLQNPLPLFDTELAQELQEEISFEELNNLSDEQQQDFIRNNNELFEFYQQIGPYQVYSFYKDLQNCFIIKAEYLKENQLLKIYSMDVDGFYTKYVSIKDLIPQSYSDYLGSFAFDVPYMSFINKDMIFKQDGSNSFLLFLKDGTWNEETANLEDFDFRKLYSEEKWLFNQIKY